jgi:glycosyltransferase involved in cell wall biosynthesis
MKICLILSTPFPPEEGIGYYVYNLSKNLLAKGHEITVITRGTFHSTTENIEGINVYRVPFLPLYPFHVHIHGYFVNQLVNKLDVDLIHVHTPLTPIITKNVPLVSTVHTSVIEDAKFIEVVDLKSFFTKILTRFISFPLIKKTILRSNVVTTVANSVAREISDHYHYEKTIVVGNGVDEKILVPIAHKNNEKYILFIGRLSYRKGIFDLLEAYKGIFEKYGILLYIVGKGELDGKIRDFIRRENMTDRIRLLGHQDRNDLIELYQNATIFVLPSHYEGLPTVLLEAMACGLPVIATSVSGCPDVIIDGENGFLVPSKSPERIHEAISTLLGNEKLRQNFGKNARITIETSNTWDKIAKRIEDCYRDALSSS